METDLYFGRLIENGFVIIRGHMFCQFFFRGFGNSFCGRIGKAETGIEDAPPVASFSISYGNSDGIIDAAGEGGFAVGFCGEIVFGQSKGYRGWGALGCKPAFGGLGEGVFLLEDPVGQLVLGGACVWMWLKRISRTPSLRDWSFGELLSARTWKRRMSGAILAAMVSWEMVRAEARSRKGVRRRMGRMWKIGNGKK